MDRLPLLVFGWKSGWQGLPVKGRVVNSLSRKVLRLSAHRITTCSQSSIHSSRFLAISCGSMDARFSESVVFHKFLEERLFYWREDKHLCMGISFWNSVSSMKSMNFSARSPFVVPFRLPTNQSAETHVFSNQ